MSLDSVLLAWEFPRCTPMSEMVVVAREATPVAPNKLVPPDLQLRLLSSTGDTITVQVVKGMVPVHRDVLLYVRGRGVYEVLRQEPWPHRRVLLTLGAWPIAAY